MPVRERYLFTRSNRLRMRFVAFALALSVIPSLSLYGKLTGKLPQADDMAIAQAGDFTTDSFPAALLSASGDSSDILDIARIPELNPDLDSGLQVAALPDLTRFRDGRGQVRRTEDGRGIAALIRSTEAEDAQAITGPHEAVLEINKGDTLAKALKRAGVGGDEAQGVIAAMEDHYSSRNIRPAQDIRVRMEPAKDAAGLILASMTVTVDPVRTVTVTRTSAGGFAAELKKKDLKTQFIAKSVTIRSSLYASAASQRVPSPIIAKAIRLLSYSIDFQRDIRQGDRIELMYDSDVTEDGYEARTGDLQYVKLVSASGREIPVYRYEFSDGREDYLRPDGSGLRKGLLRTPIDGGRVTSGFGMRRHPIMGYSKMHKGVDFGAPTGTPVYAAGDGVVEKVGRWGAYGNYVRIRHNTGIKTAYAHLSRFGKSLRSGSRVAQGTVIGYVGSTGRSTGPHLHYEVLVGDRQVNPKSTNLPLSEKLAGRELRRFKNRIDEMERKFKTLTRDMEVASRDDGNGKTVR